MNQKWISAEIFFEIPKLLFGVKSASVSQFEFAELPLMAEICDQIM